METERLRQLEAIARLGTVTAAAEELRISQPALSRSIARLEQELGQQLFDRAGRHMRINAAGQIVLDFARVVLREESLMSAELASVARRGASVVLGSVAPAPLRVLVSRTVDLGGDHLISTKTLGEEDAVQAVLEGRVDLGVGLRPSLFPAVESRPFMQEQLCVAFPAGHRLASRSDVAFADLDGETFLLQVHVGFWRRLVEREMPRSVFLTQENRAEYLELSRRSATPTFVSDAGADPHEADGRIVIPITDASAHPTYYLLVRTDARVGVRMIYERAFGICSI